MRGARGRGGRSRAHLPGRALHGTHDAVVRGAAAEMAVQRRLDVAVARPGIAIEQRLRRHHHAVAAVAALAGLLLDERPLERMQRLDGAEPLDRRDVALRDARDRRHAGAHGLAVHQHRACAALREPTAELGSVQLEVVAQDIKEGRVPPTYTAPFDATRILPLRSPRCAWASAALISSMGYTVSTGADRMPLTICSPRSA